MYIDYELVLTLLGINAIGALGYYFTLSSGQISLAHGALFAVGGYAGGYLAVELGLPWLPTLLVGIGASAAVGGFVAFLLQRTRGLYFAVATLAFGGVVVEATKHADVIGGAYGYGGIPAFTTLPIVMVLLVVVVGLVWAFDRSPLYIAHAVARVDPETATVLGIDVRRARTFAFAVGGGIVGLAGVLYAGSYTIMAPQDGGLTRGLSFLLMVVIGGVHSWRGAVLGAAVWTLLPEVFRATDEWRMVGFGVAAIILMVLRPGGLIPRRIMLLESLSSLRSRVRRPLASRS
jgi:branched-chain amino acid transport system permease protein